MNTRTTTLTVAGAALALALTGCTGNEGAGGTSSTPPRQPSDDLQHRRVRERFAE